MMFRDDDEAFEPCQLVRLFLMKKGKGNHPPCPKSNQYVIYERKTIGNAKI